MDIRRAEAECREHKRQQADYQSSARFHGPRTEPRAREFQIVLGAYRTGQASWGWLSSTPPLLSRRFSARCDTPLCCSCLAYLFTEPHPPTPKPPNPPPPPTPTH